MKEKQKKIRVEMTPCELIWAYEIIEKDFLAMEALGQSAAEMPEKARKGYEARTAMLYRLMQIVTEKVIRLNKEFASEGMADAIDAETEENIGRYAKDKGDADTAGAKA